MKKLKQWKFYLYRLQQNLMITSREAKALWFLLTLLFLGIVVSEYQKHRPAFSSDIYAKTDSLFLHATNAMKEREQLVPADSHSLALEATTLEDSIATFFKSAFPININTATHADLEKLPRIGPKMAQRIIDYRTSNGPFQKTSDLKQIKGIGEKTFERLQEKVSVK